MSYYSDLIGRRFDSDGERRLGEFLFKRQEHGEITGLVFQKREHLAICVSPMLVDFFYFEDEEPIWHEFKQFIDPKWIANKKVWEQIGPGEYRISNGKMSHGRTRANEVIWPRPSQMLIDIMRPFIEDDD